MGSCIIIFDKITAKLDPINEAENITSCGMRKDVPFYFDSTGIYVAFRTGVVGITADGCVVIPIE